MLTSRKRKRENSEIEEIKSQVVKEEKQNSSLLTALPDDVFLSMMSMLDAKSLANLSASSRGLFADIDKKSFWKSKFLDLGCEKKVVDEVFASGKITNYARLYHAVSIYDYKKHSLLLPWEMYCLSGSVEAIKHALPSVEESKNYRMIHLAALSGSVPVIKYIINNLKNPSNIGDVNRASILHLAVKSESIEAIDYALKFGRHIFSVNNKGESVWHYAVRTGSVSVMKHIAKKIPTLIQSKDHSGANAFVLAAENNSTAAMKFLVKECKFSENSMDRHGFNALHYAALKGSIATIKYAVEELHLPLDAKTPSGRNVLQLAVSSNSVEAVRCIRQLCADRGVVIDPLSKDNRGNDAFFYAARFSNNPEKMCEVLTEKMEPKNQAKSLKK